MNRTYLKQAFASIKENPLVSAIAIGGVAIAIAMAMVVVFVFQIQTANYRPETKRDRMLYINGMSWESKTSGKVSTPFFIDYQFYKECLSSLQTAELITRFSERAMELSLPHQSNSEQSHIGKAVDFNFWRTFDFEFIEGKPFSKEEATAELCKAVVSEGLARAMFKRSNVVGEAILIELKPYTIVGVVRDVSKAAKSAYANVWIPYSTEDLTIRKVCILAKKSSDFTAIRKEIEQNIKRFNDNNQKSIVSLQGQPFNQLLQTVRGGSPFSSETPRDYLVEKGLIILFFIALPAINLTGTSAARIRKRYAEFGIRKAFGATKREILLQIFYENLVFTITGGAVGLLLSFLFLHASKSLVLLNDVMLTFDMLFQPTIFIALLMICLVINILSSLLPTWAIVRQPIDVALREE